MLYQKRKFFKISYYITHPKISYYITHPKIATPSTTSAADASHPAGPAKPRWMLVPQTSQVSW